MKIFNYTTTCIVLSFCKILCMESVPNHYEQKSILYAPWRATYDTKMTVDRSQETATTQLNKTCPFCDVHTHNKDNLIVYRGKKNNIILTSQPYIQQGTHLLIVPHEHIKELSNLSAETRDEKDQLTQQLCTYFLQDYYEICINTNQGKSAGASIPDHYHQHIIIKTSAPCYNLIEAIEQTRPSVDLSSLSQALQRHLGSLAKVTSPLSYHLGSWHDCYFCGVIKNIIDDEKHLIIHRGEKASIMLSHFSTYLGQIDIVPHEHCSALETMDHTMYEEMNYLTYAIYPLLLKILPAQDCNIGLNSYGKKALCKEHHIRQHIIPRKESWIMSPIIGAHPLSGDVKGLYRELLLAWKQRAKL